MAAAVIYACALFIIAGATSVDRYLVGMAIGGAGFGMYMAIDLALVVDVLDDPLTAAKDLGVLNIANALPQVFAPVLATIVLNIADGFGGVVETDGSGFSEGYFALYAFAFCVSLLGSVFVTRIRGVD